MLDLVQPESKEGAFFMFATDVYMWPIYVALGGTTVIAGLRCLTLFVGLRLALRGAPKTDRAAIFREFARAVGARGPTRECGSKQPTAARKNAWNEVARPHNGTSGGYSFTCGQHRRGRAWDVRRPGNAVRYGQSSRPRSHA